MEPTNNPISPTTVNNLIKQTQSHLLSESDDDDGQVTDTVPEEEKVSMANLNVPALPRDTTGGLTTATIAPTTISD